MSANISKIMTPERILGALVWQVWNHQLDDQLLDLVRTLPNDFIHGLEGDLDNLVQMARGANIDPKLRDSVIAVLEEEINTTLQSNSDENQTGYDVLDLDL